MFKLIIEQLESGYASYYFYLIWQSTQPCPKEAVVTKYGKGFIKTISECEYQQKLYASVEAANKAATEFAKELETTLNYNKKASHVRRNARIKYYSNSNRTGRIIDNEMKDGDEVVAIEWDDGSVSKENINDLVLVDKEDK